MRINEKIEVEHKQGKKMDRKGNQKKKTGQIKRGYSLRRNL
jgi:hypothetical protein